MSDSVDRQRLRQRLGWLCGEMARSIDEGLDGFAELCGEACEVAPALGYDAPPIGVLVLRRDYPDDVRLAGGLCRPASKMWSEHPEYCFAEVLRVSNPVGARADYVTAARVANPPPPPDYAQKRSELIKRIDALTAGAEKKNRSLTCEEQRRLQADSDELNLLSAKAIRTRPAQLDLADELASITKVLRQWERWCSGADLGAISGTTPAGGPAAQLADRVEVALGKLIYHPHRTIKDIADDVGINRQRLYEDPRFSDALKALKAARQGRLPRGTKDAEGNLEAWD